MYKMNNITSRYEKPASENKYKSTSKKDINASFTHTKKIIEALNSAILAIKTVHTKEEVFRAVSCELKKMGIESTVSLVDEGGKNLFLKYLSYDTSLIQQAEKIIGTVAGDILIRLDNVKEYEEVIQEKKTLFVNGTVDFVGKILPGNEIPVLKQIVELFEISNMILAPLIIDESVFGIFSVQSEELVESDLPEVTLFAHHLAGVWHKGDLLEKARHEIKVRKEAEKALKKSEEMFSKAFHSSPFAISISDLESGIYFDVNEKFLNLTGYPKEEVIGKSSVELNLWLDNSSRERISKELERNGFIKDIITDFKNNLGQMRTWKSSLEIIELNGRKCILSLIDDITEEKKVLESLSQSEEMFAKTFALSPYTIGISELVSGKYIDVNENFTKFTGYKKEEIIGKSALDINLYVDTNLRKRFYEQLIESGSLRNLQAEIRIKSGEIKKVSASMEIMELKNKLCILVMAEDITDRKKSEEKLKESNRKINTLINNLPGVVYRCKNDDEWTMEYLSDGVFQLTGYPASDFINNKVRTFSSLVEISDKITIWSLIKKEIEDRLPFTIEYRIKTATEQIKWVWERGIGIYEDGKIIALEGYITDITERKKADEMVIKSEKKYRTVVEQLAEGFSLIDSKGIILEWNKAMEDITGEKREDVINSYYWDVQYNYNLPERRTPERYQQIKNYLEEILKENESEYFYKTMDFVILNKNGKVRNIQSTIFPIMEGNKLFIGSVCKDVTDVKTAEEENILLAHTVRSVKDAISLTDMNGNVIYVNDAFLETYKYTEEEILGKHISILGTDRFSEISRSINQETFKNGWHGELINVKKDGTEFPIELWTSVVRDSEDKILAAVGVARDITERKLADEELNKSEKRLSLFFGQSLDGYYYTQFEKPIYWGNDIDKEKVLDYACSHQKIVEINDAMLKQYGAKREDLIGKSVSALFGHDTEYERRMRRKLFDDGRLHTDRKEKKFDGTQIWIEGDYVCLYDRHKRITGTFGIQRDRTESKLAEMELVKAKEKAEEMSKVKSSFLANMSHEVRTPLVAILGFSEVLSEMVKDPQTKNYVEMIHEGGVRLLDTMNLILDLSLIESQNVNIKLNQVDIVKEVKEVIALFEKFANKKKLKLKMNSVFESMVFDSDGKILRQVMNNLINNAIKYTENGSITVSLDKEIRFKKPYISIRVEDTGIGIPKDKQGLIWDEFRQASEGLNRSFEGTGLGLSITKKFVEKIGGEIVLEKSDVDIGSVFKVLFPVEEKILNEAKYSMTNEEICKENPEQKVNNYKPRVLYIDDDQVSLEIVKAFTKNVCDIDTALSGMEGIEKSKRKVYDAVLMDINLGNDMDGLQVTKILRECKEYKDVPVVAVTAYAMVGDKENFFRNGCTHYLSKPFNKKELVDLLKEVFANAK